MRVEPDIPRSATPTSDRNMPSFRGARKRPAGFVRARTCYDHLAGELGVSMLDAMLRAGWLTATGAELAVTARGEAALGHLGIDVAAVRGAKRAFARGCLDLTHRRHHLAGGLGAALLERCVTQRWILRSPRSRAVTVTPRGREALRSALGMEL